MEKRNVYEIFKSQSQRGNGYASWKLAQMHAMGRNCPRSLPRAQKYLELSAEQGCPLGQRDLARNTLRGLNTRQNIEAAYASLLHFAEQTHSAETLRILLDCGRPAIEKAAIQILKVTSLERASFEARMLSAMGEAVGGGTPSSRGEFYAFLHELLRDPDEKKAQAANRALWLADVIGHFHKMSDLLAIIRALLTQPDPDSKVDAYEIARAMRADTPSELLLETARAVAIAAQQGHIPSEVIALVESARSAPAQAREKILHRLKQLLLAKPQHFNEHVHDLFKRLLQDDPETSHWQLELLRKIQRPGFLIAHSALINVLLHVGQTDEAMPLIQQSIQIGDGTHMAEFVQHQLVLFKRGEIDSETALFWAECYQQDRSAAGLAAVTAVYEAMAQQTPEHKLAHLQVLEERVSLGDNEARTDLGIILISGNEVCLSNKQRAFELFSQASENDEARAMYHLGRCHLQGIGTHVDNDVGQYWIAQAAAHGYSHAALTIERDEQQQQHEAGCPISDLVAFRKRLQERNSKTSADAQPKLDQEGA